jgi:hypothetical protein
MILSWSIKELSIRTIYWAGVMSVACFAHAGEVVFPVVGDYDGSELGNVVDRNAEFYEGNSYGSGNNASLIIQIDSFRDEVLKAFSKGCGGVISFDNALIPGGSQTDQFIARFGEDKSLAIQSVDHLRTDFVATNICVPVSGPGNPTSGGFLAKSIVGGDKIRISSSFNFSFTEEGFQSSEHVCAVGGTILGRNGSVDTSKWLMKVTLDNGDIIAQIAEINFRTGNAQDDTFFGARAPSGRYITGVQWINLDGNFSGLDSLAFMTNGTPPSKPEEPKTTTENNYSSSSSSSSKTFFGIEYGNDSSESDSDSEAAADPLSLLFGSERP